MSKNRSKYYLSGIQYLNKRPSMEKMIFFIIFGILALAILGPVFLIRYYQNKRYIEKIKKMNIQQRQMELTKIQAKMSNYNTSHVLHFILTIFCLGLWIIPWFLISQSNAGNRRNLEKLMDKVTDTEFTKKETA